MVLGRSEVVSLTEVEYEQLLVARRGLLDLLSVEEKYDLLLRNFVSLERAIHEITLTRMVYSKSSWSDFIESMQAVNLEVMNLLSMCRTYIDHMPQHLSAIFGSGSEEQESFKKEVQLEYDSTLGYRVLYALRNYVQHRGLPIHSMSYNNQWVDERRACSHSVTPFISVEVLEREGDFKKKVLEELKKIGERVDLRLLVLENMSSFARLHKLVRSLVEEKAKQWESSLSGARERFLREHGGELHGLSAVKVESDGQRVCVDSLFDDMIKRRRHLVTKNGLIVNVEKHFITNRVGA